MDNHRRHFVVTAAGVAAGALLVARLGARGDDTLSGDTPMFGLIAKMSATPGQRDALISILLDDVSTMPGCLSYIVARDASDPDGIWITEVWDSEASHASSLTLPSVRDAIQKARPLIAGMSDGVTTAPAGGHGLMKSA